MELCLGGQPYVSDDRSTLLFKYCGGVVSSVDESSDTSSAATVCAMSIYSCNYRPCGSQGVHTDSCRSSWSLTFKSPKHAWRHRTLDLEESLHLVRWHMSSSLFVFRSALYRHRSGLFLVVKCAQVQPVRRGGRRDNWAKWRMTGA